MQWQVESDKRQGKYYVFGTLITQINADFFITATTQRTQRIQDAVSRKDCKEAKGAKRNSYKLKVTSWKLQVESYKWQVEKGYDAGAS